MSRYYDRAGNPVSSALEWAKLFDGNPDYRRVARDVLPNGIVVSTVWLGLDHGFGSGAPLIFETMVFAGGDDDSDCERYSTEAEARAGHAQLVEKWSQPKAEVSP